MKSYFSNFLIIKQLQKFVLYSCTDVVQVVCTTKNGLYNLGSLFFTLLYSCTDKIGILKNTCTTCTKTVDNKFNLYILYINMYRRYLLRFGENLVQEYKRLIYNKLLCTRAVQELYNWKYNTI